MSRNLGLSEKKNNVINNQKFELIQLKIPLGKSYF